MARRDDDEYEDDDDLDQPKERKSSGSKSAAAGRLAGPAICLMVVASLHVVLACIGLPFSIFALTQPQPQVQFGGKGFGNDPFGGNQFAGSPAVNIASGLIGLAVQSFIVFGAFQMKNQNSYGVAMTTAIFSVIPCFCSSCAILGIPFGIWALIVLMDADVKASFRS